MPLVNCVVDHALLQAMLDIVERIHVASVYQRHELLSVIAAAVFLHKFCSQLGSYLDV